MTNEMLTPENGERMADASVRFSAHPAAQPFNSIFEPFDNMLNYGLDSGRIEIMKDGRLVSYLFENNGLSENIPSYERLHEIVRQAGSGMSTKKGTSICGMGIEVFGLESRPDATSAVRAEIDILRNGERYGATLDFDGFESKIKYQIKSPIRQPGENRFTIKYTGCAAMKPKQIASFRQKACHKLHELGRKYDITLNVYGKKQKLSPVDMLYESELKGTEDFTEKTFYYDYEDRQGSFTIKLADVSNIVKTKSVNPVDKENKELRPEFSGMYVSYRNGITVHFGASGWSVMDSGVHSTKNGIRGKIEVDEPIFTQLHKESQVKGKTSVNILMLKDECQAELIVRDEEGTEYTMVQVRDWFNDFCYKHASDDENVEAKKKCEDIARSLNPENLGAFIEILNNFKDNKLKPATILGIMTSVMEENEG